MISRLSGMQILQPKKSLGNFRRAFSCLVIYLDRLGRDLETVTADLLAGQNRPKRLLKN
jgi:hypothetical protein